MCYNYTVKSEGSCLPVSAGEKAVLRLGIFSAGERRKHMRAMTGGRYREYERGYGEAAQKTHKEQEAQERPDICHGHSCDSHDTLAHLLAVCEFQHAYDGVQVRRGVESE